MTVEHTELSSGAGNGIELVPLATMRAELGVQHEIGRGPLGGRYVFEVREAHWQGERLRGRMVGAAAADWFLLGHGGVGTIDVRMTVRTDDDALLYVSYGGRTVLSRSGAHVNRVAAVFETGDERYAWLNGIQAVGRGEREGDVIVYRFYEVR